MELEIRLAQGSDIKGLLAMNEEFNGVSVMQQKHDINEGDEIVAVADFGGVLAAFACVQTFRSFCYDAFQGEITELYVRPEYRRQGIAGKLLAYLEQKLRERGADDVRLLTGEGNRDTQRLYLKIGYSRAHEALYHKKL